MKIPLLDHGYVELIEAWGTGKSGRIPQGHIGECGDDRDNDNECGIVEAARQSTQGSFRGWSEDAKLLKHLYEHKHGTPFEFAGMVLEIQAPIFVFREWHRHRTQSYNEMSARYEPLPDLYYTPTVLRTLDRANTRSANKQAGQLLKPIDVYADAVEDWRESVEALYGLAESTYQSALAAGIPKELARIVMPVGHYSRMRATANLRNWLQFITLRTDKNAQWEIREYADAVLRIMEITFPRTTALWKQEPHVRCASGHPPILHQEGPCPLCSEL